MNNIQSLYGLTEKIVNFVRLSKDYPYKRQVIVYIFGRLTRIVNIVRYLLLDLKANNNTTHNGH